MKPVHLLADILDYPSSRLSVQITECLTMLQTTESEAAQLLEQFQLWTGKSSLAELQEGYTATFDMQAHCSLYVGHQILGEDHRRGLFMAKLREEYRTHGFSDNGELPDHLPVLLRYLAVCEQGEIRAELIAGCVLPAIARILVPLKAKDHPYVLVLRTVQALLSGEQKSETAGQEHRSAAAEVGNV